MTLEQQIDRARQAMKNAAAYRRNDGVLLLLVKLICRPFVWWHAHVLLNILPAFAARWLLGKFVGPVNEERDGDALLHLCVDCFTITLLMSSLACYLVMFGIVDDAAQSTARTVCVLLVALVPLARCYGIFSFLALLHSETGYRPNALVRALVNTMCHYFEVVTAFGVFYLACGYFTGDSFASPDANGITASPMNSLYFSFVTITTLGYGDLSPEFWPGQLLVVAEVAFGLFLLVVVLQRAMSAGQSPAIDEIRGQLDERCVDFIVALQNCQPSFGRPPARPPFTDEIIDHCLQRLTALGILRFDVNFGEVMHAYHWTELGNEIIERLPDIKPPAEASAEP